MAQPRNSIRVPRNNFEQKVWNELKKAKVCFDYETEKLPYVLNKMYLPDFIVTTKTKSFYLEAKGYFDIPAQVKMKAVKSTNPDLDIRFLFMDSSKPVRKGSKITYAGWCEKYGFLYAEKTIPKSWLK